MDKKMFLERHGIKVTSFRETLVELLLNANKPVSYDELVEKTGVNKTTIYRNLALFEESGILISSENNGKHFYELAKSAKAYFVCDICHEMKEISMPNLGDMHVKSVMVKGVCDGCSK
ncbi:MAG: HTH domain-containing protein [Campylobacteraceae bacterium]|mgnify:CR=1 FL=1|nr:HTH domain-containing protein [Campylobacteraceae bacterium]